MKPTRTWTIEDHLCRHCGGRILKCATGKGMTPGGNPVWRCADCGTTRSGLSASELCWCGFAHRGQNGGAYWCLPFSAIKDRPELADAFAACGCDPTRGEVGIVLRRDMR